MSNTLEPGDVRVGHVVDALEGDEAEFVQAATLTFDLERGSELHVPYLWESADDPPPHQFAKANKWFQLDTDGLPSTLIFVDDKGWVTLTGTYSSGQSMGQIPLGRVRGQVAIFNRPRAVKDEYAVGMLTSTIDGLEDFARFTPVGYDIDRTDNTNRVTVTVDAAESVEWTTGEYTYAIRSNVAWNGREGRHFHILDSTPFIQTSNAAGATVSAHLEAQWPIRALLTFNYGQRLAWRSHKLRDDEFPVWMLDGSAHGPNSVDVHIAGTIDQHQLPHLTPTALAFPLFRLEDLGSAGMSKWIDLYSDEVFRHAVEPAVEVISGASRFLEPQLMMLAISLDRFGYFRFRDNRRRPMHEHIFKCMADAQLDWPEIGSQMGIAKVISYVNNDLKHPDREKYPDSALLAAVVALSKVIARAQAFDLLDVDSVRRTQFMSQNDVRNALLLFTSNGLKVDDDGELRH